MANYERGVYEPRDDARDGSRVFDGAEDEDDVEGSRLPLLIVLALLVLAMFGGVVWLAYTQGVARGRGETPILTAANGPERVAPPQGGGNTVPYQGFKIYEQPAPSDDNADAPPPAAPSPKAAPAPAAPAPKLATIAPPAAEKPAAAPPKPAPAATAPKSMASLIQQANSVPEAAKPVAKAPPAPVKPMPVPTVAASGAPHPLGGTTQMAAATPAPAAAGGVYMLQIGSYKSQAEAETAWKGYKAKHAALLSGYSDNIQQADLGEKGTWYRLRIGGFSDRNLATALCDRLKADGGACIPGK
ncbi:MAG TPA: SPOR domain-containing protein [Rhizomicrobium sp.]|nr:SPOR domain-containing protein [Rhizomicrobium sp.]